MFGWGLTRIERVSGKKVRPPPQTTPPQCNHTKFCVFFQKLFLFISGHFLPLLRPKEGGWFLLPLLTHHSSFRKENKYFSVFFVDPESKCFNFMTWTLGSRTFLPGSIGHNEGKIKMIESMNHLSGIKCPASWHKIFKMHNPDNLPWPWPATYPAHKMTFYHKLVWAWNKKTI